MAGLRTAAPSACTHCGNPLAGRLAIREGDAACCENCFLDRRRPAMEIGIPDRILLKEGPLSEDERRVMRTHPDMGYPIVSRLPGMEEAAAIARCHEERGRVSMVLPALGYSLRDDLDWTIGVQHFRGGAGSEYGRFRDVHFTALQWYF